METHVSLLQDYDLTSQINKKCYVIEFKRDSHIWYVTKRFKQIKNLKDILEKNHKLVISDFPKKRIRNSYSRYVIESRIDIFNRFFKFVNSREDLMFDINYDKFSRSDIHLNSIQDIAESQLLTSCLVESNKLNNKLQLLEKKIDELVIYLDNQQDKAKIIKKNILDSKSDIEIKIQNLTLKETARKMSHDEKLLVKEKIDILNNLYLSLQQKCCLVKNHKSITNDRIQEYQTLYRELIFYINTVDSKIKRLDDKFINHYWKPQDYQRINSLLEKKLIHILSKTSSIDF